MATQLNTLTLPDFTSMVEYLWLESLKSVKSAARGSGLFKVSPFPANTGDTREFNEMDLQEYASIKDEGDDAEQALIQQGYTKTLYLRRFGKDIPITWEMRRRNKYEDVVQRVTNVAKMQANRMDLDLSHRLTFMASTSYTDLDGRTIDTSVGDGYALAYTAHTVRGSATTYRNILANNPQVSPGALENMQKMKVENTINQLGEKMAIDFDLLWTTEDPTTVNTVREILQSTAKISSPNEGVPNVQQGMYRHVILPRVATTAAGAVDSTKAKYWGIASSAMSTAHLSVEQEPMLDVPSVGTNAEEFSTEDLTYKGRTSYGICIVNGTWGGFSKGDGSA